MGKESDADQPAEIVREYGPFPGAPHVHGVSFDGSLVWFAGGEKLQAFEPASGRIVRALDVACDAGTAFDGRHLFQIAGDSRARPRSPSWAIAIPRSARAAGSSRRATRLSAPSGSAARSARPAAVIEESIV